MLQMPSLMSELPSGSAIFHFETPDYKSKQTRSSLDTSIKPMNSLQSARQEDSANDKDIRIVVDHRVDQVRNAALGDQLQEGGS